MTDSVGQTLTATGRIRRPSISQVCHWVKKAWDDVTKEVVVKSFKKAPMPLMGLHEEEAIYQSNDSGSGRAS